MKGIFSVGGTSRRVSPLTKPEITDVQKEYLKRGTLEAKKLTGKWLDAGDFDDLLHAN